MSAITFCLSLLIVRGLSAHISPRLFTEGNDADAIAMLEVNLDPPAVPFPVAQHEIDRMEAKRERLEAGGMHRLLGAFETAKETARTRLSGIVKHAMYTAVTATPRGAAFLQARTRLGPAAVAHPQTTARVQVYAPDMGRGVEVGVKALEQHRSETEGSMIEEAIASMAGITDVVCAAFEVELRQWSEGISDRPAPTQRQESFGHFRAMSFAERNGDDGNVTLHDNIKIVPPAEFPTIASLVGAAEARRGMAESLLAWKAFHLQLRLLREEHEIARGLLEQALRLYAAQSRK